MCRVAGNKDPAPAIFIGEAEPEFPEADIIEINIDGCADSLFKKGVEVKIVTRRTCRNRRMEEPVTVQINPAEELPVPVQVRIDGVENCLVAID